MCGVLLSILVDCETASSRDVIRINILRSVYDGTGGQYQYMRFVVIYLYQIGQILSSSFDEMTEVSGYTEPENAINCNRL